MIFVEQSERSLIRSRLQRRSEHLSAEMFSFYIKSILNTTTYYFSLHFRYRTGQTENKLYKIYYVLLLLSPERSQTLLYCQFESTLPSMYLNIYWYIIVI